MFYYLYEYLAWMAGYGSTTKDPEPTVEKTEDVTPHEFPSLNFTNIAELETQQETPSKKKKHKW